MERVDYLGFIPTVIVQVVRVHVLRLEKSIDFLRRKGLDTLCIIPTRGPRPSDQRLKGAPSSPDFCF